MTDELPSLNRKKPTNDKAETPKKTEPMKFEVLTTIVEIQYAETANVEQSMSYQETSGRVDLGEVSGDQLRKIKAIRRGLDMSGACLKNGKPVVSNIDAVRYLLDALDI